MGILKCKICGGTLEIDNSQSVATCEYCGTKQTLPKIDDERKANLYDRANHFRRNNDFDKAMSIYEQILNEDHTDAESYWSILLCRYGIEYVEDPSSHKHVPTVNRAQYTSIFDDEDYKSAIRYADVYQREIYETEAAAINEIQKGILSISQKEEPFDVFICYKETDANGRRTQDSVLATELYHELVREGFKVFFSRITLEDKLGVAYEPYIFAALNSSKVMVVLGTRADFFNAVWVKNEWSRYLALIKNGAKKILIPAYRDMDPYDLPEEFSHLQAQDMSKLGFMQDLTRGIKKIIGSDQLKKTVVKETIVSAPVIGNIDPLLKRAFMSLEDGEFDKADDFCEQVLNQDPENAKAYLGKLMADLRVKKASDLFNEDKPFNDNKNYQKVIRFADEELSSVLKKCINVISERNERRTEEQRKQNLYNKAKELYNRSVIEQTNYSIDHLKEAIVVFRSIADYKDSTECIYLCEELITKINKKLEKERLEKERKAIEDRYLEAIRDYELFTVFNIQRAIDTFTSLNGYKDSNEYIRLCKEKIEKILRKEEKDRIEYERLAKRNKKIAIVFTSMTCAVIAFVLIWNIAVKPNILYNEALKLVHDNRYEEAIFAFETLDGFRDSDKMISICNEKIAEKKYSEAIMLKNQEKYSEAISLYMSIGTYKDSLQHARNLADKLDLWNTISTSGVHTVGLKSDGTVVAVGANSYGQCNVSDWKDIVSISTSDYHTVGLKSDGTVVAVGDNELGECNVSDWKDIVSISTSDYHTVGLKSDGTVVAVGGNGFGQCNVSDWKDIVSISADNLHTVGLKLDGTVVAVGCNNHGQCDILGWKDIVSISIGNSRTVGLKSDGTVVAVGYNNHGQCNILGWKDIVSISTSDYHTVGLKSDGTVVAVGNNEYGKCNVLVWRDIISISTSNWHTVGLRSDGTVVAVGTNDYGKCDVSEWKDIIVP